MPVVVDILCERGVDMNVVDSQGNCPLWQALDSGQEDIAHILVRQVAESRIIAEFSVIAG